MDEPSEVHINREGYLVTHMAPDGGARTYACTGRFQLYALIFRLTGREAGTFCVDERLIPVVPGVRIAHPLHIYGETPRMNDKEEIVGWAKWYREAREDMAFRFGVRRVPVDAYKERFALGDTPIQASRAINDRRLSDRQ